MSTEMSGPTFKMRVAKSSARKREMISDETSPDDEETSHTVDKLKEYKQLKSISSRGVGIEFSANRVASGVGSTKQASKSAQSQFQSQFSSQTDRGIGVNIAHESVMEKYVNERLGLKNPHDVSSESGIQQRPIDAVYAIPQELKVESGLSANQIRLDKSEEQSSSSWSTGIAEVSLPEKFRLQNQRETEIALARKQSEQITSEQEETIFRRFRQDEPVIGASSADRNGDESRLGQKRQMQSSDDFAVKKFRQVCSLRSTAKIQLF